MSKLKAKKEEEKKEETTTKKATKFEFDLNEKNYKNLPILITGGAGYIGSHTIIELINKGFTSLVVVDNYINSSDICLKRVEKITKQKIIRYNIDIAKEGKKLDEICKKHKFYSCIHFAGLKAVGESVSKPLLYYNNNLISTLNLLESLNKYGCKSIVFSSSATVYGNKNKSPLKETSNTGSNITNPYGQTKYMIEVILKDFINANPLWNAVLLRYFNPIGAHQSGLIGEDPQGPPNNLLPYISQVAVGRRKELSVFGNDYDTIDGTGVRDYIHVVDLAKGHVMSLINDIIKKQKNKIKYFNDLNGLKKYLNDNKISNCNIYNLGTGKGTSVLQLLKAFEKAAKKKIPYKIVGRRDGDVATCYADASKAKKELNWVATLTIDDACKDTWKWQSGNPKGFAKIDDK